MRHTLETEAGQRVGDLAKALCLRSNSRGYRSLCAVFCAVWFVWAIPAGWGEEPPTDFAELSLEELLSTKMTLVTRKAETLSRAPAAISVLTQEEIRRSGVTTLAEVLRMVPGFHVGHIDGHTWTVSSRGFGGQFANKLLVLIDGRSVYTPLFSGVYWEVQDVPLEEVERIEVIRGPGATLWGTNAVNGIINIVTQKAQDTQGTRSTAGGGSEERGFTSLRHGGKLGEGAYYRIYGKFSRRDALVSSAGEEAEDEWDLGSGGFRLDWDLTDRDVLALHGHLFRGNLFQELTLTTRNPPFVASLVDQVEASGGHVMGRWERVFSRRSELVLQLYYDRTVRRERSLGEVRNTWDLDFQHRFGLGLRQEILWGGGYRFSADDIDGSFVFALDPAEQNIDYINAFVQDDITLIDDRLRLILGAKFERNDYTGWEIQPNLRGIWSTGDRHAVWGAISRAVRLPSRAERGMSIIVTVIPSERLPPDSPTTFIGVLGNRAIESENLHAFEVGYRLRPSESVFLDLTAFYNLYRELILAVPGDAPVMKTTPPPPYMIFPSTLANKMDGETYGVELASNWQISDGWRLQGIYSYMDMQLQVDAGVDESEEAALEGRHPRHQAALYSRLNVSRQWIVDGGIRYMDDIPDFEVESCLDLDLRLGWEPFEKIEISIVGQNLLYDHRAEFSEIAYSSPPTERQRGAYGAITWRF